MVDNILITGGSGLLALNWLFSVKKQYSVTLAIHKRKIFVADCNIAIVSLDSVESVLSTLNLLNPSVVIHTAGMTNVDDCEAKPDQAHYVNVSLAENVAKACSKAEIPLVHISTDHLFSGDKSMLDERSRIQPLNVYGKTKGEGEQRVLDSCPEALVVRTNFYGWGSSYRHSFSDSIICSLNKGQSVSLFDDVFYTPIIAEVLVKIVHELISKGANGIFNVVGDERLSKYEFGIKVAKQFKLDTSLIQVSYLAEHPILTQRPYDMSLSNKKLGDFLGKRCGSVDEHLNILYQQYIAGVAKVIQEI